MRLALEDFFVLGRADRAAVVFFLELRVRVVEVFFFDDFLADAFAADFFLVTFFATSFRLADDLPALLGFFLALVRFFVDVFFLVTAFFLAVFFLPDFFLLVLFPVAFFVPVFLVPACFLDDRDTVRLREVFLVAFFDTFFAAAAFFFGMR